jgi:hypothetical protein
VMTRLMWRLPWPLLEVVQVAKEIPPFQLSF